MHYMILRQRDLQITKLILGFPLAVCNHPEISSLWPRHFFLAEETSLVMRV